MQAIQMGRPATDVPKMRLVESADPLPGAGEVLIEVAYAGINFIDVMARRGDPGYASSYPFIAGCEVAGVVRDVGEGVHGFAAGDRVAAFVAEGGFAEFAIAAAALTARIPSSIQLSTAAAAPLMVSTAVLLLEDVARVRPGESVVMHSASGGLGSALAQVAAASGAGVRLGTVGGEHKIAAARASGWDVVIVRGERSIEAVRDVLPGGADVVLDPLGTRNLHLDLEILAPGGRIVLFGNPAGDVPEPLPGAAVLSAKNAGLLGFSIRRLSVEAPTRVARALARALSLIESGALLQEVAVVRGLAAVDAVLDDLAAGRGVGKYVVALCD